MTYFLVTNSRQPPSEIKPNFLNAKRILDPSLHDLEGKIVVIQRAAQT